MTKENRNAHVVKADGRKNVVCCKSRDGSFEDCDCRKIYSREDRDSGERLVICRDFCSCKRSIREVNALYR